MEQSQMTFGATNFFRKLGRLATDPIRLRMLSRLHLYAVPFQLGLRHVWPGTYLSYVPDRYALNRDLYTAQNRGTQPWMTQGYLQGNATNNGGDLCRWYFLNLVCDQIIDEKLTGNIAELGVYKGNTAELLARLAKKLGTKAYLLDTFEGFEAKDIKGVDANERQYFADTSLAAVRALVGEESSVLIKGYFPETADQIPEGLSFVLVHLDCDLYAPTKAGLEYFYPRTCPGAFIVMHDYSSLRWQGARQAVDDFFSDKPEKIVPIPDKSGTAVVRKISA